MSSSLNILSNLTTSIPKNKIGEVVGNSASSGSGNGLQPTDLTAHLASLNGDGLQGLMTFPKFGGLGPEIPSQSGGIGGQLKKIEAEVKQLEQEIEQMTGGGDQTPSPMQEIQDGAQQMQRGRGELKDARSSEKEGVEKLLDGNLSGAIKDFQSAESSRQAGREDMRAGRQEAERGFQAETTGQGPQQSPLGGLFGNGLAPMLNRTVENNV